MQEQGITIYGERPDEVANPSSCATFKAVYPTLFAPMQVDTFNRVQAGRSLALVAPTSSGKTLAVAAPLFETHRKAVFVYPFRALVLDQTNQLVRYGRWFGLTEADFTQVMGGKPEDELARAIDKKYILMTPDKLVSLFQSGRIAKGAALTILTNYVFVFDEIHTYNSLMRASLIYFIRSIKYWHEGTGGHSQAFYFLSATFPDELWTVLQQELEMTDDDRIEGVSNTGNVSLILRPRKDDPVIIAQEATDLGMNTNVVAIFNTAIKAWHVAEKMWGNELARQRLFVGQDKMSERQRAANFQAFVTNPSSNGLCGSPAIEAGVDFATSNLIIEETYADSFLQRFGRSARSGKDAIVLCYSSALFEMFENGKVKRAYPRKEFLNLIRQILPIREPGKLLAGLAAYPYYKFWDGPEFLGREILSLCQNLERKGVDHLLAFRGFIPFTHYQTGESINYRTLFRKDLKMENDRVIGSPTLERYFYAKPRLPVIATCKAIGHFERIDESTTALLAKVAFDGFGTHWTVLEYKKPEYERGHPYEPDDNICLRGIGDNEAGRISEGARNGILRFYEVDA